MAGPFKLRSGNTPPFKQMGSSKALQSKIAKEFKLPVSKKLTKTGQIEYVKYNAAGNRVDMMGNEHTAKARANRNRIGAPKQKGNVDYKAKSKLPKNFNAKGGPSTTPGYKDTKIAKAAKHKKSFDARQVSKQKGKQFVKGLKKAGKFVGGKTLGVAGMMMAKSASADQPGTGKHGGTKTGTYNPKTNKYE